MYPGSYQARMVTKPFCYGGCTRVETHAQQVQKILDPIGIPLMRRLRETAPEATFTRKNISTWHECQVAVLKARVEVHVSLRKNSRGRNIGST